MKNNPVAKHNHNKGGKHADRSKYDRKKVKVCDFAYKQESNLKNLADKLNKI